MQPAVWLLGVLLICIVSGQSCHLTLQSSIFQGCNADFDAVATLIDGNGSPISNNLVTFHWRGADSTATTNNGVATQTLNFGARPGSTLSVTATFGATVCTPATADLSCFPTISCSSDTTVMCDINAVADTIITPSYAIKTGALQTTISFPNDAPTCTGTGDVGTQTAQCTMDTTSLPNPSTFSFSAAFCGEAFASVTLADGATHSTPTPYPPSVLPDPHNWVISLDVFPAGGPNDRFIGLLGQGGGCCTVCGIGVGDTAGWYVDLFRLDQSLQILTAGQPYYFTVWTRATDPGGIGVGKAWQPYSKPVPENAWSSWTLRVTPGQFQVCRTDLPVCDCETFVWPFAIQRPNNPSDPVVFGIQGACNPFIGSWKNIVFSGTAEISSETCTGTKTVTTCVKQCSESNGGCDSHATCTQPNAMTSPTCTCNAGYGGDGITCTLLNCDVNNGGCDANAQCCQVNPMNSPPECTCNTGFQGDGKTCTDIDECTAIFPCADAWQCINVDGSWGCIPRAPYRAHDHDQHVKLRWQELGDHPRLVGLSVRVTSTSNGMVVQTVTVRGDPEWADDVKIKHLPPGEYTFQLIAKTRAGDEIEGLPFTHTVTSK